MNVMLFLRAHLLEDRFEKILDLPDIDWSYISYEDKEEDEV
jgi:hypothetical protein